VFITIPRNTLLSITKYSLHSAILGLFLASLSMFVSLVIRFCKSLSRDNEVFYKLNVIVKLIKTIVTIQDTFKLLSSPAAMTVIPLLQQTWR